MSAEAAVPIDDDARPPPPPPLMVKRRSSRLEGRAAAAPYPPVSRAGSKGGSSSSGLTPVLSTCSLNASGFDASSGAGDGGPAGTEADALVTAVLGDMEGVRQAVLKRASTLGQLGQLTSVAEDCAGAEDAGPALTSPVVRDSGRAASLPVRKGKMSWRSDQSQGALMSRGANSLGSSSVLDGGSRGSRLGDTGMGPPGEAGASHSDDAISAHVAAIAENLTGLKEVLGRTSMRRSSVDNIRMHELAQAAQMSPLLAVLHEVVTTEHHYVEDLRFFVQSVVVPLSAVLAPDESRAIFSNAQQLLGLHEGILAALKQDEEDADAAVLLRRVSDAFEQRIPFFKMYAEYCSNYVYAAQKLRAVKEIHAEAAAVMDRVEAEHETTALALLIRPVARICQYPLLFREVQKHMAPGSPHAAQFSQTTHEMASTIEQVNEKVRRQENALRMRGILTAELHGAGLKELIDPSRALLYEAQVRLRAEGSLRPEMRAKRDYKLYLFSDLLLAASRNLLGSGYSLKLRLDLAELRCEVAEGDEKPSFLLVAGGVTYRGSCATRPDVQELVAQVVRAKQAILLKTLGALPTAGGMARATTLQ